MVDTVSREPLQFDEPPTSRENCRIGDPSSLLSTDDFIANEQQMTNSPTRQFLQRSLSVSGTNSSNDLRVGTEASTIVNRPHSARKLTFDPSNLQSSTPIRKQVGSSTEKENQFPSDNLKGVLFSDRMSEFNTGDNVSDEEEELKLTQPVINQFVDTLNKLFASAEHRMDQLSLMCVESAELEKFAVDIAASNRSAQFRNIESLNIGEARRLLKAEMLKNEQGDERIERLTKRILQLEKRLAVTETAEKCFMDLKTSMEKQLSKMLDSLADAERKRIKHSVWLSERNRRYAKMEALNVAQNQSLSEQIKTLNATVIQLNQELSCAQREGTSLRCQVDSLQRNNDSLQNEITEQRKITTLLENRLKLATESENTLKLRLTTEKEKVAAIQEELSRFQEATAQERKETTENHKKKIEELTKKYQNEEDKYRADFERELISTSDEFEKNLKKLKTELTRAKADRDELVMRLCEYERNNEEYRRKILADAQQKLAVTCQKAVCDFVGSTEANESVEPSDPFLEPVNYQPLILSHKPRTFNRSHGATYTSLANPGESRPDDQLANQGKMSRGRGTKRNDGMSPDQNAMSCLIRERSKDIFKQTKAVKNRSRLVGNGAR
ncbi:hypothetical protein AB6A40_003011 [Gnathostoma spinigerum]|uniref:Uncharacterized protein n=1 Tax=Gnathostoma spinigerum TaxID=75299 RepID=A0ABD6EAJ9_9BILA